jgi:hypothetical protein
MIASYLRRLDERLSASPFVRTVEMDFFVSTIKYQSDPNLSPIYNAK